MGRYGLLAPPQPLSTRPMPRPAQRRTHLERTELSDRLMLDATASLILEVGTQKTTLKEVGERAGYSRGLANARFGNKETLFLKLADRCRETWVEELQQAAQNKTGLAALMSRLDAMISYVENYPESARVMYILWFESVGSNTIMKEGLAKFHKQANEDIANLVSEALNASEINPDVNPEHFAMHFTSTLFGLSYQWLVNPEGIDINTLTDSIKQQMQRVLLPV